MNRLARRLGTSSAVLLGLGSILGTGVFLSLGLAAHSGLSLVIPGLIAAAFLALLNGLSSAQLAASHPVSGGTYSYGARYLGPLHGFAAGWLFLCAKSASAATAALTLSGSLGALFGAGPAKDAPTLHLAVALACVWGVAALALVGIEKSARVNAAIVGFTVLSLGVFAAACIAGGAPGVGFAESLSALREIPPEKPVRLGLEACALLFVAFTGYGRVATLGEEVRDPARTIPRAIWLSVMLALALYLLVAVAAILAVGPWAFGKLAVDTRAPLPAIARAIGRPDVALLVSLGAITALASVLLNLILGLSRVALAMGRSGDLPTTLARVRNHVPRAAVLSSAGLVSLLVLVGDVEATWSFSAFSVLVYYGITHWAALALPEKSRLYPRWTAWAGLGGCLFLAFQVPNPAWITGSALLVLGVAIRSLARSR